MSTQPNEIAALLTSVKESLEREIQGVSGKIDTLLTRFDTQAGRLERQGALIQTGSRWTARMNDWSEKVDAALEQKDKQIAALAERIEKLERNKG
jgi:hypothetical protein